LPISGLKKRTRSIAGRS